MKQIAYPEVPEKDRFTVQYDYNAFGHLAAIADVSAGGFTSLWKVEARNAEHALTQGRLGNDLLDIRTYEDLTGRLKTLSLKPAGSPDALDVIEHGYDSNGNLETRAEPLLNRAERFSYDALERLRLWDLTSAGKERATEYQYDALGNLTNVLVDGQLVDENLYGQSGKPHALTSRNGSAYVYDDAGRMSSGGGRAIDYTTFNLPRKITTAEGSTLFDYDAFGQRVRKTTLAETTISIGGLYERRTAQGGSGATTKHVFRVGGTEGQVIQVIDDETTKTRTTQYIHADRLGSARLVTDASGAIVERFYVEPFGQRIEADGTPLSTLLGDVKHGFTGHRHDDELGLIDMRGRIYDPALRRFLTPDPIVSSPLLGQNYNRFSYVLNNPLNLVDPSGYDWIESPGYVEFSDDPLTGSTPVGEGEIPSGEIDALWEVYEESSLYSSMPIVAAEPPVSDGNYSDPAGTAPARTESHGAEARSTQGPLRCVGCPDGLAGDNIGPVGGVAITSLVGARFLVKLVYGLSLAARTMPVAEATVPAVAGAVQSKSDALTRAWEAAKGGAVAPIRRVGDLLDTADDVLANPKLLDGMKPQDLMLRLGGKIPEGWRIEAMAHGRHAGQGFMLRQYTSTGDPTGRMIQWHPGGGHHGPMPYWKINAGHGPVRFGPQF